MGGQFAALLIFMGALMLFELGNPEETRSVDFIGRDQTGAFQLAEERGNIHVVKGKDFGLDLAGPVFKTAFAVGQHPQAGKEQTGRKGALRQLVVFEKSRLDVAASHRGILWLEHPADGEAQVEVWKGRCCRLLRDR